MVSDAGLTELYLWFTPDCLVADMKILKDFIHSMIIATIW